MTETLSRPIEVKAGPDDDLPEGTFTAYASVFDNVDSYRDVMVKGAFENTLAEWKDLGAPIPVYWGHNISDPDFNVGHVEEAREDARGLFVKVVLDLESPKAAQTYRLLKGRRVREMSFGFSTVKSGFAERDGREVRELSEVKLFEVSVVPVGANPDTEVISVRSASRSLAASVKAGRSLNSSNEAVVRAAIDDLRDAADSLEKILPDSSDEDSGGDSDESQNNDQDKATGGESVEEKTSASSAPSVDVWAEEIEFNRMKGVSYVGS